MRRLLAFGIVLVVNLILGVPAYFVSFLFAYGFEENVHVGNHVAFLVIIGVFATVTGLLAAALAVVSPTPPFRRRAAFGVLASLAVNSAVVGAGSIVSAAHKDDGSVSASFSTTTDVLVATALFVLALVLGAAALRVGSPSGDRAS